MFIESVKNDPVAARRVDPCPTDGPDAFMGMKDDQSPRKYAVSGGPRPSLGYGRVILALLNSKALRRRRPLPNIGENRVISVVSCG